MFRHIWRRRGWKKNLKRFSCRSKKRNKKKRKSLKALLNDNYNIKTNNKAYKCKNKQSNENQTNKYKDNEYEPKNIILEKII